MKMPGFLKPEGSLNLPQFLLVTLACILVCIGLIFLVLVHVVFMIITIPGIILMIGIFVISLMKWLSHSEEKEGKLSSLWSWDLKEKNERARENDESGYDDETQRQIEEMKNTRDEGKRLEK